jgi:hypothetical protein
MDLNHIRQTSFSRRIGIARQTVFLHFGPFHDTISHLQTYIYIYNDPVTRGTLCSQTQKPFSLAHESSGLVLLVVNRDRERLESGSPLLNR